MGDGCNAEKCWFECTKHFSKEIREDFFKNYWQLSSIQRQRDFLHGCVEYIIPRYRRTEKETPRKANASFRLPLEGKKMRVCRKFLLDTLGIGDRILCTIIESRNSSEIVSPEDKRGKHKRHKRVNLEVVQSIRDHIIQYLELKATIVVRIQNENL